MQLRYKSPFRTGKTTKDVKQSLFSLDGCRPATYLKPGSVIHSQQGGVWVWAKVLSKPLSDQYSLTVEEYVSGRSAAINQLKNGCGLAKSLAAILTTSGRLHDRTTDGMRCCGSSRRERTATITRQPGGEQKWVTAVDTPEADIVRGQEQPPDVHRHCVGLAAAVAGLEQGRKRDSVASTGGSEATKN